MKKTFWIVVKGGTEIIRVKAKKMAEAIASQVGGSVQKYTVE